MRIFVGVREGVSNDSEERLLEVSAIYLYAFCLYHYFGVK